MLTSAAIVGTSLYVFWYLNLLGLGQGGMQTGHGKGVEPAIAAMITGY